MTGEAIVIKTEEEEYTNMEIGDVNDEQMSRSSSADTISESRSLPQKQPTELRKGVSQEVLSHADKNGGSEIDVSEAIQPGSPSASMCQGELVGTDIKRNPFWEVTLMRGLPLLGGH